MDSAAINTHARWLRVAGWLQVQVHVQFQRWAAMNEQATPDVCNGVDHAFNWRQLSIKYNPLSRKHYWVTLGLSRRSFYWIIVISRDLVLLIINWHWGIANRTTTRTPPHRSKLLPVNRVCVIYSKGPTSPLCFSVSLLEVSIIDTGF